MGKFRYSRGMAGSGATSPVADTDLAGLRLDPDRGASNRAFMARFVQRYRETLRALAQR
jgi:hypothetical protein